jgi:glutaredoxin 3
MGRITVFGTNDYPHCMRAKGALILRGLPFSEIDLTLFPYRRKDMMSLSDQFGVPQVFFNETYVGGADELLEFLVEKWDIDDSNQSASEHFQDSVASKPDPKDPRLAIPKVEEEEKDGGSSHSLLSKGFSKQRNCVRLPDGKFVTVLDTMLTLGEILDTKDRPYKARKYKNCFINSDGVTNIMKHHGCTRKEAVDFCREL